MIRPTYETFDFRNPDYTSVFRWRAEFLAKLRADPQAMAMVKAHYRNAPWDFINDWGITFDPRNVNQGLPPTMPFVLFKRQVECLQFMHGQWQEGRPGLIEKSRDVGLSWLVVGLGCAMCVLNDDFVAGYGSRKEEYVDKLGHPKSLFYKARLFMKYLPREFRAGWSEATSPHMRLEFPETRSVITGEAGDNIGRGDRTSVYYVDEAQPLTAAVLTPSGWETMGDMRVGAQVIGSDGKPTLVTHINDCGERDVYRVEFSDGTFTYASEGHLWLIDCVIGGTRRIEKRTCEIYRDYAYHSPGGQTLYRYRVPLVEPVEFCSSGALPLDPYIVGALLGDGNLTNSTPRITSADQELINEIERRLPEGCAIGAHDGRYSWNLIDAEGRKRPGRHVTKSRVWKSIDAAGLKRVCGPEKSVPAIYLMAKPSDRLLVLRGLMDTDGHAQENGGAAFHTSSSQLAQDVAFLARSLGGWAKVSVRKDGRGYRDQHYVQVVLPNGVPPFMLPRKVSRIKRSKRLARTIVNVESVGRMDVRCITVANPDGLYVTDDFIVTHNCAYLERANLIEASLSATTNCRIDLSSVNGMGNVFAEKRHSGRVEVFVFDWRDDPRKDDAWYAKQCETLDPITIAQEIDRNYLASVEGQVIPGAWVQSAIDAHVKLGIQPTGDKFGAFDVADEGKDKCAWAGRHGVVLRHLKQWSGKDSDIFASTEKVFGLCDEGEYEKFRYDADGLGADVKGAARVINERRADKIEAEQFRGSGEVVDPDKPIESVFGEAKNDKKPQRLNKDYFKNAKAQAWWSLRHRFLLTHKAVQEGAAFDPDKIISLPSDLPELHELRAELSRPTWDTDGAGKIIIDKSPDGQASPNLADAVMICYAPRPKRRGGFLAR